MYRHLRSLVDDLNVQIDSIEILINRRHLHLMCKLSAVEKEMLAKTFVEKNWNVGSSHVMKFLQESNVLSMTDYILFVYNQNAEEAQLMLSEILEKDFSLLADLLKHTDKSNAISLAVNDLLLEGFRRLCNDVMKTPSELLTNYLSELEPFVQGDCLKEIRLLHLELLLQEGQKYTVEESLNHQHKWNNESATDHKVFQSFLQSIIGNDSQSRQEMFTVIIQQCTESHASLNWKSLLLLLSKIVDSRTFNELNYDINAFKSITKAFVKAMFRDYVDRKMEDSFFKMFLIARQISQHNELILGTYASWYKDIIGGVEFLIKKDEFEFIMKALEKLVRLETDTNILDVHINTYIPPPPLCNQIVLNYKQLCRSKLLHLNQIVQSTDANDLTDTDVFIID